MKNKFQLSKRQKAVLIGTLLGDGNLTQHGKDFRLFIKHSASQSSLVKWKRNEFTNITGMNLNFFEQRVKGKVYKFCQFVTLTHTEFTKHQKIFYREDKKIVSPQIGDFFKDPLSLAVWIMDDGARANAGMTLQTHSFSSKEVRSLQECLKKNFGISTNVKRNKGKDILYIPKGQVKKLYSLVKRHLLSEYKYKFPLAP